jgi:hypothetical protein
LRFRDDAICTIQHGTPDVYQAIGSCPSGRRFLSLPVFRVYRESRFLSIRPSVPVHQAVGSCHYQFFVFIERVGSCPSGRRFLSLPVFCVYREI